MGTLKIARLYDFLSDYNARIPIDDRKIDAELNQQLVAANNSIKSLVFGDSPYTVGVTDQFDIYLCNATGGAIASTLAAVGDHIDEKVEYIKTDSSVNTVTVNGVVLYTQGDSVKFISDGTIWHSNRVGGVGMAYSTRRYQIDNSLSTYMPLTDAIADANEAISQCIMPRSGKIRDLSIEVSFNSLNGNLVYTVRKNAGDTAITKTIGAAATGSFYNNTSVVSFAKGDLLNYHLDTTAANAGFVQQFVSIFVQFD